MTMVNENPFRDSREIGLRPVQSLPATVIAARESLSNKTNMKTSINDLVQRFGSSIKTGDQAEAEGYAKFNRNTHFCLDIPDGEGFTITCRLDSGKRMTFAFVSYGDGVTGCVDIKYWDSGRPTTKNGDMDLESFDAVGFTPGHSTFDTRKCKEPTTLMTVLIADKHYTK